MSTDISTGPHSVPWTAPRVYRRVDLDATEAYMIFTPRRTGILAANVVTSESAHEYGLHFPAIDLDFPAHLVPSATPGHHHLYLDRAVSWKAYKKLLKALAKAGLVEPGYVKASIRQGFTTLRLPWIRKVVKQ